MGVENMLNNQLKIITVKLGKIVIQYKLHYELSSIFFGQFVVDHGIPNVELMVEYDAVQKYYRNHPELLHPSDAEVWLLLEKTALALYKYDCGIFHSVALIWKDRAWLFTAPSGTGKTTQYLNWEREFNDEIQIINGDKPILSMKDDRIYVHGSPWRGKEKLGRNITAPLGGIVVLEQGSIDQIRLMNSKDAVIHLFNSFWIYPETKDQINSMACIIERIVQNYPVWKLTNIGDKNSAYLVRKHFKDYLEQNYEV